MHQHYENFNAHDFLTDPLFRKWVLLQDESSEAFWQTYRTLYPHKEKELDKARQILLQLHNERRLVTQEIIDEDWEKLQTSISSHTAEAEVPHRSIRPWLVAASISLFLAFGFLLWNELPLSSQATFKTAYGETRQLTLPDSSVVILNANSSLEFDEDWSQSETRQVWLNGEAFFEVREKEVATSGKKRKLKFIVHTPELQVQVVGTAFSVNTRSEKTQVTLNSGKVIVRDNQDETVEMEPGEQVEFNHQAQKLIKKKVIPENYNAWKDNKLEFVNMPIPEILKMLEERYGWQFEIEANDFLDNRYKGSAPAGQPQVLLNKWQVVYGLKIKVDNNQITITEKQ